MLWHADRPRESDPLLERQGLGTPLRRDAGAMKHIGGALPIESRLVTER